MGSRETSDHASPLVDGRAAARFGALREAFERTIADGTEVGAALAVWQDGEFVVDLWGGHADPERTRPWERDTLVNVYSTTKGITALAAHRLVDRGELDLDAPVTRYWPELSAGKDGLTVRGLLGHRAGLPGVRRALPGEALYDWRAMTDALAVEEPWWEPGTAHGYHAVTFGWLVGEVVRRVAGSATFRDALAELVTGPLDADFHVGLAPDQHDRVARMGPLPLEPVPGEPHLAAKMLGDPEGMTARAFTNPISMLEAPNNAAWREAEIPGANGHGTARALARIYGAVACGESAGGAPFLSAAGIDRCRAEVSFGPDLVIELPTRFGAGFMLPQGMRSTDFGPNAQAFGHPGAGGSLAFADPENRIGFAYVMNRMGPYILLDPRAIELVEALYGAPAA